MNRLIVTVVLAFAGTHFTQVLGACTYTDHTTALNSCVGTATGGTSAWGFPHGTNVQQANMCLTASLSTLKTCIETIFSTTCSADAKSVKMFSTAGLNVYDAIANLCAEELIAEAQACMGTATLSTYTTQETSFKTNVDALPSVATQVEICGLAKTLKYQAFDVILTTQCTTSSHREVWERFYDTLINTYGCVICSASSAHGTDSLIKVIVLIAVLLNLRESVAKW